MVVYLDNKILKGVEKMRKFSLIGFSALVIFSMLFIAACGSTAPTPVAAEKSKVGLDMYFRRDEWWKDLEAQALKSADENKIELLVQDGDADPAKQLQQLETFVSQGVKAIVYAPIDAATTADIVKTAHDKGIKVLCIETCLDDRTNIDSWVQFDQKKAGYDLGVMAGEWLNKNYGGKGKVAIVINPTNPVQKMRYEGWKEGLKATAPGAEIVAEQNGADDRATAMSVAENVITANPDVVVWYPFVEEMAFGVIAALDAAGVDPAKVAVFTEGWGQETLDNMAGPKPWVKGAMITPSTTLAKAAVDAVGAFLNNGTALVKDLPQTTDLVTPENALEYFKARGYELSK
jgi:ribose transport system substrate-binding protein